MNSLELAKYMIENRPTDDQLEVMRAFLNGAEIEVQGSEAAPWIVTPYPEWWWGEQNYRVKPKTLTLPWEIIQDRYKWAAMDEDGSIYLYTEEPYVEIDSYHLSSNLGKCAILPLKIDTEFVYWRESKVKRP